MYTSGRPPWGGRARASFVECGLILMGTDDKQRKQASSLPGEICLLLAGVQRGPDTRASHTDTRHVDESRAAPSEATVIRGCRCNPGGVGRATPERAEGEEQELPGARGTVQRSFTRIVYARALGYVSRRVGVTRVNQRAKGRRRGRKRMIVCRYLGRSRPDPRRGTRCGLRTAKLFAIAGTPARRKASVCSPN